MSTHTHTHQTLTNTEPVPPTATVSHTPLLRVNQRTTEHERAPELAATAASSNPAYTHSGRMIWTERERDWLLTHVTCFYAYTLPLNSWALTVTTAAPPHTSTNTWTKCIAGSELLLMWEWAWRSLANRECTLYVISWVTGECMYACVVTETYMPRARQSSNGPQRSPMTHSHTAVTQVWHHIHSQSCSSNLFLPGSGSNTWRHLIKMAMRSRFYRTHRVITKHYIFTHIEMLITLKRWWMIGRHTKTIMTVYKSVWKWWKSTELISDHTLTMVVHTGSSRVPPLSPSSSAPLLCIWPLTTPAAIVVCGRVCTYGAWSMFCCHALYTTATYIHRLHVWWWWCLAAVWCVWCCWSCCWSCQWAGYRLLILLMVLLMSTIAWDETKPHVVLPCHHWLHHQWERERERADLKHEKCVLPWVILAWPVLFCRCMGLQRRRTDYVHYGWREMWVMNYACVLLKLLW